MDEEGIPGLGTISEVRFISNTTDADAKVVGNEGAHIVGGCDSCCLC